MSKRYIGKVGWVKAENEKECYMNQDLLRIDLIKLVGFGMKLNSIAQKVNIKDSELSSFKNGFKYLKKDDAERLSSLLGQISIPENV